MAINPRWKTGRRRIYQQRFRALGLPCSICGKAIDYSLPYYVTDEQGRRHVNMWAFCIDEKIPVSKWQQGGYNSPSECANDFNNLQPCHVKCNAQKGNKTNFTLQTSEEKKKQRQDIQQGKRKKIILDGKW